MTDTPTRFTLRQLPIPAKLVLSCFLIAVGLGYFSAMVQLHLQHSSRNGEHLPGPGDVVEIFAGKKKADPAQAGVKPVSKLERLIMGPIEGAAWNGSGSMAPAFFHKDGGEFNRLVKENPGLKEKLDADRNGERLALQAWINAPVDERQKTYEADSFLLPESVVGKPITKDYLANNGGAVKVRTLLTDRCLRCHRKGESVEKYPLETYSQLVRHLTVPAVEAPIDGWVRSDRQVSIEKLTQSTHAHLLSFAMLFTLTGLVFAFTDYSVGVRCLLAPMVLVAQVIDVACWWLARIDGVGVIFATAILGTGGIVGLGLIAQIVLSLFNMYGPKGKAVMALVLLLGGAGLAAVYFRAIAPALQAQRDALAAKPDEAAAPEPAKPANVAPMPRAVNGSGPTSQLERVVLGPIQGAKWDGKPGGSMAGAFFHKDGAGFARKVKADPGVRDEREGERQAVAAWARTPDPGRKAAYDADAFPPPPDRAGKPITPDYLDGGKVKVRTLLTDRCARCHLSGGEAEDYPLETYEQILKYLGPEK